MKTSQIEGPWRSIHGAIWMIGLAILFWKGWWWPGILILVAISSIAEALIRQYAPDAVEKAEPTRDSAGDPGLIHSRTPP
jgi:hypothetical protein